ncbi:MAG TPA: arylesterase [Vicinamibacterales bacterium]|nr:arylesterase [Vicinamibacterales bacterium]
MNRALPIVLLLFISSCSLKESACGSTSTAGQAPTAITGEPAQDPSASGKVTLVFLGDSLTAGYQLLSNQAYPAKIGEMFEAEGYTNIDIDNAGLSGDTSAGGLRRVEQLLTPATRILVIALGGNDALRGLGVNETRENLRKIIDIGLQHGASIMLCGMEGPTNLGEDYRTAFKQVYFDLLRAYQRQIVYVPFLLEGVAGRPELNQTDGIHPNEAGSKAIAEHLYPQLKDMVDRIQ